MKKSSKSQEVQRITVKSPLIPLFPKGETRVSSLWLLFPARGRQREVGRDFEMAKQLQYSEL
jgi:hypothetical protein